MAEKATTTRPGIDAFMSASFWARHRARLLGVMLLGAIILILSLLFASHGESREGRGWNALMEPDKPGQMLTRVDLDGPVKGTLAEPWALLTNAYTAYGDGNLEEAEQCVSRLQSEFPDHPASRSDDTIQLLDDIRAESAWKAANPTADENPQIAPEKSVTVETELGNVVVGLYLDEAPVACREFLKLVREGQVLAGSFDEVGSYEGNIVLRAAATSSGEEESAGASEEGETGQAEGAEEEESENLEEDNGEGDDGPAVTEKDTEEVAKEPSKLVQGILPDRNNLSHYAGSVSFRRVDSSMLDEDPVPQISIYLDDSPYMDDREVVFGTILEGLELLKQVSTREVSEGTRKLAEPLAVTGVVEASGLADVR